MPVEQGLALLDALNGDGGAFWEEYAGRVLPNPASLSIPFCLAPCLLRELQHHEIMSGAGKQQVLSPVYAARASVCYILRSFHTSLQHSKSSTATGRLKPIMYEVYPHRLSAPHPG